MRLSWHGYIESASRLCERHGRRQAFVRDMRTEMSEEEERPLATLRKSSSLQQPPACRIHDPTERCATEFWDDAMNRHAKSHSAPPSLGYVSRAVLLDSKDMASSSNGHRECGYECRAWISDVGGAARHSVALKSVELDLLYSRLRDHVSGHG